jgi:hypothetical protein
MLEKFIGFIIDLDPGPILLVQPREPDAEAFSKARLALMIRDWPGLRGEVGPASTPGFSSAWLAIAWCERVIGESIAVSIGPTLTPPRPTSG